MSLLDGMARSATVTSVEVSKLFIIQRAEFLDLLAKFSDVSVALLTELTKRLRSATMKIKALSLKDAEGKVATVLLQLADDVGKIRPVSYTHLRAHETVLDLVCRLLLEKKNTYINP